MKKPNFKSMLSTFAGASGGAIVGDFINDKITDMVDDNKMEIGAKILAGLGIAYFASNSKGIAQYAAIGAIGSLGQGIKESFQSMQGGSAQVKGVAEEMAGIHAEIEEAMRGLDDMSGNDENVNGYEEVAGNDAIITGNDAIITGNDAIITGVFDEVSGNNGYRDYYN